MALNSVQGDGTHDQLQADAVVVSSDGRVVATNIIGVKRGDITFAVGYNGAAGYAKSSRSGDTFSITGKGDNTGVFANPAEGIRSAEFEIVFDCQEITTG